MHNRGTVVSIVNNFSKAYNKSTYQKRPQLLFSWYIIQVDAVQTLPSKLVIPSYTFIIIRKEM